MCRKKTNIFISSVPCLLVACWLFSFTAKAQDAGNAGEKGMRIDNQVSGQIKGNTYALIVGISSYKKLPRLNYADSDALAFRNFLTSKAGGRVPPANIRLYLNDNDTVTGSTIYTLGLRNWLSKRDLKKGDRIYIYLSGHGDAELGTSYFLTSQCNPVAGYQSNDALQISTIKDFIRYITPLRVQVIFIFDACRTNEKRTAGGQVELNNFIRTEQVGGEILMIAADAGETSIEDRDFGGGHGLFTYYLLLGMSGYADSYPDGKITFNELESYVKKNVYDEAQKRKHEQTPYFNTVDKNPVVAYVDTNYFNGLVKADSLHRMLLSNEAVYAARSGSASKSASVGVSDSNALSLYNAFSNALRDQRLLGANSADSLYIQLQKNFPAYPLTDDARYLLANEFINYAQRKINIHINGKDISYVNNIKKKIALDSTGQNPVTKEVKELERVMKVKFGDAARMMQRAMELLKDDTSYIKTLQTKHWFLQAKSYYDELNSSISYDSALRVMRRAVIVNPNASYYYNLLGQLYRININKKTQDSAEMMFTKSITLTPEWIYPYRNLAGYYREKANYPKAIEHYKKAVSIDSTDAETYNEMGILYYSQKDYPNAEFYYKRSLAADSSEKYAARNLGLLYAATQQKLLSEKFYLLSVAIDSNYASSYYELAYDYALNGKNELAEKFYKKAIEKNTWNADYPNDLAVFYYNQGKDSLAEIYYRKAITTNPKYIAAHNNLGLLYKKANKLSLAKFYYHQTTELDPKNLNAYNGLGLLYLYSEKKYDSAEYHFKKTIAADSTFKYPYYNLGNLYVIQEKYTLAEKYFKKAISLDSAYSYAYYMLGGLYKKMNQPALAEKNYLKAIALDSANAYILNDMAVLANDQANSKMAENYYKKAIARDPKYLLAYTNLALLYKKMEQYGPAEEVYKQIIVLDKNNPSPYNGLGLIYDLQKGKESLAESSFKKTLQIDSNYKYAWYNLGNVHSRQKAYPEAERDFLKAIRIDSNYTYAYYMLAGQYYTLNNNEAAERYYLKAIHTDSFNVNIRNDLALLYERLDKKDLAEKYYKSTISINPKYRLGYTNLAYFYKKQNKMELSEKYYAEALKLDTLSADLYNRLGLLYYDQRGKDTAAENAFKKAAEINNHYVYPLSNLGNLYVRQHKYELAETYYLKAIAIEQKDASLYNALGYTYLSDNKPDQAVKSLLEAVRLDSLNVYAYSNLGDVYRDKKEFALSEKYYIRAIAIDSNYKYPRERLGSLYLEASNEPGKARMLYEKMVIKYPADSNMVYDLACAHSRLGNIDRALHFLEEAIKTGMKDTAWMRKDSDLEALRKDPRFEMLLTKYFPR